MSGATGNDRDRVRAVRAFVRQRSSGPTGRDILRRFAYQVYVVAVVSGLWVAAVARTIDGPRLEAPPVSGDVLADLPAAVVALALVLTVVGMRLGTWTGPVLVSRPEAAWLLPAPLDRRVLLGRRLVAGLGLFALVGGVVGLAVGTVVAFEVRTGATTTVATTTLGFGALGMLVGTLALAVESSHRLARTVLRTTPVALLVVAALSWLAAVRPDLATWTTPWGWAAAPVATAVSVGGPSPWLATGLLVATATVATRLALHRLGGIADEELVRRAGAASAVSASAALFDARAIAQLRRAGQRWLVGVRDVPLPRSHRRWTLVARRDLASLLRRPGAVERTVVVVVAAAGLVAVFGGAIPALVVAVVAVSGVAGQLVEPLRIELEEPVLEELTPLRPVDVTPEHLAVPAVTMATAGVVAVAVGALSGVLDGAAVPAALLAAIAVGVLLAAAAGLTATRESPPLQWLLHAEPGVFLLVGWVVAGPLLALALVLPLALAVNTALAAGATPLDAVAGPALVALLVAGGLAWLTTWRVGRRADD
ncbi:DUF6297 family protein [Salsipaludibacter albus]|uniref:DUF6297 family protein n=1 Tax=Salsipaludibacter albus TaxID=2849650 RepID=UPI001EE3CBB7|nr:hypothetical protein [Salsipaludibacter albus]